MGVGWWGALYDESRRNKVLIGPDQAKMKEVVKANDWNDYVIRAEGKHIQLWINGFQTVDYTETDPSVETSGVIAVQIHAGPPSQASVQGHHPARPEQAMSLASSRTLLRAAVAAGPGGRPRNRQRIPGWPVSSARHRHFRRRESRAAGACRRAVYQSQPHSSAATLPDHWPIALLTSRSISMPSAGR